MRVGPHATNYNSHLHRFLCVAHTDLIIKAKSGTGKTLVFCTIILDRYQPKITAPQSLIVAPTREIALQIESVLNSLGAFCAGFKAISVIGGRDISVDRKNLNKCRAIVCTPGRALHLINNKLLNVQHIKVLVFDEADKLMTADFRPQMHVLMKALPQSRQFISASATYANKLDKLIVSHMRDPVPISVTKDAPTLVGVKQFIYSVEMVELDATAAPVAPLIQVMLRKVAAIERVLSQVPFKQCILFSNSQMRAESFHSYLLERKWTTTELIVGSHEQHQRISTMEKFRQFESRILITSDLLARGIDIENIDLVINVDVPADTSTYLHRIGRCGRFGTVGIAITLIGDKKDQSKLEALFDHNFADRPTLPDLAAMEELDLWNCSADAKEPAIHSAAGHAKPPSSLSSSVSLITTATTHPSDDDGTASERSNDNLVEMYNYELLEIADLLVNRHEKPHINISDDICADYQNHVLHPDGADEMDFESLASYMQHRERSSSACAERSATNNQSAGGGDVTLTCSMEGNENGTGTESVMDENSGGDRKASTLQDDAFINVLKADKGACDAVHRGESVESTHVPAKIMPHFTEERPNRANRVRGRPMRQHSRNSQTPAETMWSNVYWTQVHHINHYMANCRSVR